jgi:hypothetical protein
MLPSASDRSAGALLLAVELAERDRMPAAVPLAPVLPAEESARGDTGDDAGDDGDNEADELTEEKVAAEGEEEDENGRDGDDLGAGDAFAASPDRGRAEVDVTRLRPPFP